MNRALFAAASGMAAQQQNLDVISQNLANSDVTGFKSATATFAEMGGPGRGLGTASLGTHQVFTQGKLVRSGGPFDIAIEGNGFFVVRNDHGTRAYTRDGSFSRASDGTLRNAQGWKLEGVRIPNDAISVTVSPDGSVRAKTGVGERQCGALRLAMFASPERLAPLGSTMFAPTPQAGHASIIQPGKTDGPQVRFGMLEASNVSIVESMMQILSAQRAYEANAKGVQAVDEMMRIANNINRG